MGKTLIGAIGNQYSRLSEIMVSGMSEDSLQWQVFSHTRPGVVDTGRAHGPGQQPGQ
ncbi:MAG: hypothetical protein R3E46_14795 [Sedimenticolaceae bacterium]